MVNLLVIAQKIVFLFYYMIELLRLFQKRSFALPSEHKNEKVATIGTLLCLQKESFNIETIKDDLKLNKLPSRTMPISKCI